MLITLILVMNSYVTSDECCACQGLRQSGGGQAVRHTRRAEVASKREREWLIRRSCCKIGKRVDEGRSASQKPEPSKSQAEPQEQEPSLFLLLSSQRVLRPKFQNRTQIAPLKIAPRRRWASSHRECRSQRSEMNFLVETASRGGRGRKRGQKPPNRF